ncbi:prepilin-type N-terminal cleavage/methylation domain-containing protein [Caminibacter profundus]
MKKSFTLIELLFVIVIIGVLASFAIPKFKNLTTHSKESALKSVVSSVQTAIDNIHGEWIINDNFKWDPNGDGVDDLNENGYPKQLDNGTGESKLFKYVLKIPIVSCGSSKNGCWEEPSNNIYRYYFTPSSYLEIEYNSTNGTLECKDGSSNYNQSKCEEIVY